MVEQLFELPLKSSTSSFDLDTVAKTVNNELKGISEESFVESSASNPRKRTLEVSLAIVKDVIATKQAENQAELARRNKSLERKKLLDAIGAKKDEALTKASLDELEKQLAALEN
jgi:hypothetical protein